MGEPITQVCSKCKKRKPIKGFSISQGRCADCKRTTDGTQVKKGKRSNAPETQSPKTWKCPYCLQRISVKGGALVKHKNGSGADCRGSRHDLPQRSRDAFDYRAPGNFEGGSRR